MRRLALVISAALLLIGLSACAEVKPWERGILSLPAMDPNNGARKVKNEFIRHCFDVREGATGGDDFAGGGCGCN